MRTLKPVFGFLFVLLTMGCHNRLVEAAICVKKYQVSNPVNDAVDGARKRDFRPYVVFFNGDAAGFYTPSIKNCDPEALPNGTYFKSLHNPAMGDEQHYEVIDACNERMVKYATAYNAQLFKISPESVRSDCRGAEIASAKAMQTSRVP